MVKTAEHNRMTFEVVQYTGKNYDECTAFIDSNGMWPHIDEDASFRIPPNKAIATMRTNVFPGDFIIKDVSGLFMKDCFYATSKGAFELFFRLKESENEVHDFGWALRQLKAGEKVQRKGWNSKGMFITLQPGSTVKGELMRNEPAKEFYSGKHCVIMSHIDMKAADDSYTVGWNASQIDMLAEDWQLA